MKGGKDVRFNVNCVFQIIFCFASEKIHAHFAVALFFFKWKNIVLFVFVYLFWGKMCRSDTVGNWLISKMPSV